MEKLNKQRGLRNCNPLNIRRTADLWQGLAERQPDPEFFTFRSMPWGYRAAFIVGRGLLWGNLAAGLPQIWFTHGPRHRCPMGTTRGR